VRRSISIVDSPRLFNFLKILPICTEVYYSVSLQTYRLSSIEEISNSVTIISIVTKKLNGGRPGKPYECMIDGGESPTAHGSFDSRRRVGGKENLDLLSWKI